MELVVLSSFYPLDPHVHTIIKRIRVYFEKEKIGEYLPAVNKIH